MTKLLSKSSKGVAMSDMLLMEAHGIVRQAAEPWEPGDSVKAAINRAARALHLSFRRARSLWYCEASCALRAHEIDSLRHGQRAILQERLRRNAAEREAIATRLAALEGTRENLMARLEGKDLDGDRQDGDAACGSVPGGAGTVAGRVML